MKQIKDGYKETSIGVLPEEWDVVRLFDISKNKGEYGIGAKAVEYVKDKPRYLRITDFDECGRLIDNELKSIAEENYERYILKEDDLVFARTGNTTGKSYLYREQDGELVFAGFLIKFMIDSTKANSKYIKYCCQTKLYWDWVKMSSTRSGQPGLNSNQYGDLKLPLPSLPEQQRIAEILSATDAHLEKLEAIIADTQLLKKGMMQQLLTRGIGHTEFKDTEIGQIPKAWEVVVLNKIVDFYNGKAHENDVDEYGEFIIVNSKFISTEGKIAKNSKKCIFPLYKDDIVLVMSDVPKGRAFAKTFLIPVNNKYTLNQRICCFRNAKANPKYLNYLLSRNKYYLKFDDGVKQTNLRKDEVLELTLPLPPLPEQQRIAEILSAIDDRIQLYKKENEDFIQLKKGLMEQLLTGKTRVKE